ncbi:MAG: hypothetical protein M3Z97_11145 [Candidatus Dormibacteraeota bacterium]|nr:hypothetical protein [Candidatus Dormibacteraeota bacterium]
MRKRSCAQEPRRPAESAVRQQTEAVLCSTRSCAHMLKLLSGVLPIWAPTAVAALLVAAVS